MLAICGATFLAAGLTVTSRANADEYTKSYSLTGRASVHVDSDNGEIRVITSDGTKVDFDVKYDKAAWEAAGEKGPLIDSRQSGNSVELTAYVRAQTTDDWNPSSYVERRLSIDIEVRVPRNADLRLETHNGLVDVSSVNGNVTIKTHNGGVHVARLSGTLDIDSHNGGITLDAVKGSMKVGTHNGRIAGNGLDGKCAAVSHNGAIDIKGRFDSLDASSSNGAVDARAEPGSKMSSNWSIETTNARIDLAIPTDLKATVNADTNHGQVTFDLPVTLQGAASRTQVRGSLNGGGPDLLLRTTNGAIHVHKA
jgi:DUF4097 and DUF4098 domain-containing protein YvlB